MTGSIGFFPRGKQPKRGDLQSLIFVVAVKCIVLSPSPSSGGFRCGAAHDASLVGCPQASYNQRLSGTSSRLFQIEPASYGDQICTKVQCFFMPR